MGTGQLDREDLQRAQRVEDFWKRVFGDADSNPDSARKERIQKIFKAVAAEQRSPFKAIAKKLSVQVGEFGPGQFGFDHELIADGVSLYDSAEKAAEEGVEALARVLADHLGMVLVPYDVAKQAMVLARVGNGFAVEQARRDVESGLAGVLS